MNMKGSILVFLFAENALGFHASPRTRIGNRNSPAVEMAVPRPRVAFSPASSCDKKVAGSPRRTVVPIGMAEDDAASDEKAAGDEETLLQEKIAGRKKRLIGGYKIMTVAFASFGAMLIATTKVPLFGAPSLMVAGISYIMIGAAENNRLASDTYKRLNIALFEFGIVGLLASIGMKLGDAFKINTAWLLMFFVAVVNSIKGYGYGLKGWELGDASAIEDLTKGAKSALKTMARIPNIKSAGYLAATLVVGFLKLQKLGEVFCGRGLSKIAVPLTGLARLMVLTIVLFTLKDAADRDRLEGTTFVQLNALSSLWFLAWAAFRETAGTPLRPLLGAISGFAALNGVLSVTKKKGTE